MTYMNQAEDDLLYLELVFEEYDPNMWGDDTESAEVSSHMRSKKKISKSTSKGTTINDDDDTTNAFAPEIAWYHSDNDSSDSGGQSSASSRHSTNLHGQSSWVSHSRVIPSLSNKKGWTGSSSQGSWSPCKK